MAWDGWALTEHFGDDGAAGEDGEGIEWIHCLNDDTSIPSGELPPDSMAYDAAVNSSGRDEGVRIVNGRVSNASRGGRVWFDEQPESASASQPWLASMFRRVPGIPARGTVPSGDAWGPWRGPVFQSLYVAPPVTVNRAVVEGYLEWSNDSGWKTGTILRDGAQVQWRRGPQLLRSIRVYIDGRVSNGQPQCRMRLSVGSGSSPVKVDDTTLTGRTYRTEYGSTWPCQHTIEVEGVVCAVNVRLGAQPPQIVTAEPTSVALFVRQTGVTYSADATWTKAGASGSASYRTVRFSVSISGFGDTPNVTAVTRTGRLGSVTKGSRTGGGTVWTTPFTVEGVDVRVIVVYVDVSR